MIDLRSNSSLSKVFERKFGDISFQIFGYGTYGFMTKNKWEPFLSGKRVQHVCCLDNQPEFPGPFARPESKHVKMVCVKNGDAR